MILVCSGLALIASVLAIRFPLLYLQLPAAGLIGISFVLWIIRYFRQQSDSESAAETPWLTEKKESDNVQEQVAEISAELNSLKTRQQDYRQRYSLFVESLPVVQNLADIISEKAEQSTLQVTENIFSIADNSLNFNKQINGLLEDLFTVDQGLEKDINRLIDIAGDIERIVAHYRDLGQSYIKTMRIIEKDVRGIYKYTGSINELAELTNILAINASIEAARMGVHGKGFTVIARGVQELSQKSQEIAQGINEVTKNTADTIENTFAELSTRVAESVEVLETANSQLKEISSMLETQIRIVGLSLAESKDFSGAIHQELNEITVSLQFQDMISQVLNHMMSILQEVAQKFSSLFRDGELTAEVDREKIARELKAIVEDKLTVQEEWAAAGLDQQQTQESGQDRLESEELQGDITLF